MGSSLGMLWEGERGGRESGIKGEERHWMV